MLDELMMLQGFDEDGDLLPLISMEEDAEDQEDEVFPDDLPVLALKNTVLFPGIVIPITVGRDRSIKSINTAYESHRLVAVFSQHDDEVEEPTQQDLYPIGTIARILKLLRMPDGTTTAILQGRRRGQLVEMLYEQPYMRAIVRTLTYAPITAPMEFQAMAASIMDRARKIIELSPNIPSEAVVMLRNISNPRFLLNFIASNLNAAVKIKQELLSEHDLLQKGQHLLSQMDGELQMLELKDQIENKVRGDIEKQQRDYFLNQQLKTIQEELGSNPQEEEHSSLIAAANKMNWEDSVRQVFDKEFARLKRTNPQSPDYGVVLNYLELLLDLPWQTYTEDNFDLHHVQQVLDKDHYGLEDVKKRILEHLAVLKLRGDMQAPILCLVGPPGVGKTSLGRSIATALKRQFIRMSLGGLHDESEIRGHRRTYIGAMPGRILKNLKRAGSNNPVFLLDEIDKVGKSFRGDPSSALLEVLDPEQNKTFYDNYLDIEYDLSKILFIATANSLSTIQPALRDRMEIIHISGYSTEEKTHIARRHLIPDQRKEHGFKASQIKLPKKTLLHIIRNYTRESGVRALDRQIGSIMRSIALKIVMDQEYNVSVAPDDLRELLGPAKYPDQQKVERLVPGVAIGLAWTQVGGDILYVECSLSPGKGRLTLTGNLGDVMKESATTALSYLKSHSEAIGFDAKLLQEQDIHLHVPEGAIPKDGPSAGITMLIAMSSALTDRPVRRGMAMTGEITLRGRVLPVGGIKEKVLAAKRAGMTDILLCSQNERHVDEIKPDYIKGITFHYVSRMEHALQLALEN